MQLVLHVFLPISIILPHPEVGAGVLEYSPTVKGLYIVCVCIVYKVFSSNATHYLLRVYVYYVTRVHYPERTIKCVLSMCAVQ